MKRLNLLVLLIFFTYNISLGQNSESEEQAYAIVQVLTPQSKLGNFKISIFYGNKEIEEYKIVKYNRKNRENMSTHIVDVLNYMENNGYKLKSVLNFTITTIETQCVFRKKEE